MRFRHPVRLAFFLSVPLLAIGVSAAAAGTRRPVDIPERVRGADHAVVGRVVGVHPRLVRNAAGDELIVSRVRLHVEETLKGAMASTMDVDVEGGRMGDLTLHVSDLPDLAVGERAVFFLRRGPEAAAVPHLRGLGILKLDARDHVERSSLSLDMIRTMAAQAIGR